MEGLELGHPLAWVTIPVWGQRTVTLSPHSCPAQPCVPGIKGQLCPTPPVLTQLALECTSQKFGRSRMGFEPPLIAGIAWSHRSALTQHSKVPPLRANLLDLIGKGFFYYLLFKKYLCICGHARQGILQLLPHPRAALCVPQGLVEHCEGHKARAVLVLGC